MGLIEARVKQKTWLTSGGKPRDYILWVYATLHAHETYAVVRGYFDEKPAELGDVFPKNMEHTWQGSGE